MAIPPDHPRKKSLDIRHKLVSGYNKGLVAEAGLIAHGRGEAYDYLLGEKTSVHARKAEKAACAMLLSSDMPVLSVNGNSAALCPHELVELANLTGARLEVNLFYRTVAREKAISAHLKGAGARKVYGLRKKHCIPGLGHARANVDDPLWDAETVLVMLEDGDRTEALKKMGKKVIAVDLNPLSRTARMAEVTIVDNIVRALPAMIKYAEVLAGRTDDHLDGIIKKYDNRHALKASERLVRKN
ncbi:phosphopantothenate/pantothenate synthetase [Candidatus Altiarchaeota archaeon]